MCAGYLSKAAEDDKKQTLHTRQICWIIYQANADPKKAVKSIDDFWQIGDKPKPKVKRQTKAEKEKIQRTLDRINQINNG